MIFLFFVVEPRNTVWCRHTNLLISWSGFDWTFKKLYVSFSNKNSCAKLSLNTAHHGWAIKKKFHFRSLTLLPFYRNEKHKIRILYQKTFLKKDCFKILCNLLCTLAIWTYSTYSYLNYAEFHIMQKRTSDSIKTPQIYFI